MKYVQLFFTALVFLICAPVFADDTNDPFQGIAAEYRAANPKPTLPEEARKYRVQAEFMVKQNQFQEAANLYAKGLELAPWWPQGHYDRGFILGQLKQYRAAVLEMKHYLALVPKAPNARLVQDQIYQWEAMVPDLSKLKEFQDCPDCPVMVALPVGSFDMGSNNGLSGEKPVHLVTISQAFAIGKTVVTQGQWRTIMGNNPSHFNNCGENCPVEMVNWNDAQAFIQKLNANTGKQYRLPSEAEWEYACHAGEQQEYCGSNNVDSVAWYNGNSGQTTHPVASKQANAFGLYDMSGNVWEWIEDSWHDSYNGAPMDGSVWQGDGANRDLRGGSWNGEQQDERAAVRVGYEPASERQLRFSFSQDASVMQ
ncbi:MAG: SUMF1/EgtB/PvdO family nonheme iron enzyme [Betaproteobacteria bacterium]|nr:SUMF1/EgtB/PvdO family nonheme iron enzyme [Betaproteobacteria bacterium]